MRVPPTHWTMVAWPALLLAPHRNVPAGFLQAAPGTFPVAAVGCVPCVAAGFVVGGGVRLALVGVLVARQNNGFAVLGALALLAPFVVGASVALRPGLTVFMGGTGAALAPALALLFAATQNGRPLIIWHDVFGTLSQSSILTKTPLTHSMMAACPRALMAPHAKAPFGSVHRSPATPGCEAHRATSSRSATANRGAAIMVPIVLQQVMPIVKWPSAARSGDRTYARFHAFKSSSVPDASGAEYVCPQFSLFQTRLEQNECILNSRVTKEGIQRGQSRSRATHDINRRHWPAHSLARPFIGHSALDLDVSMSPLSGYSAW